MRKLASVQKIESTMPIKGKDRIELVQVLGWQVIVRKNENFKVGDLVVYVEIDSIMPHKPEFEFLEDKKYRIKTMRMAGVISQGIVFPLSILPSKKWEIGDDVTEVIGIEKYEPDNSNKQIQKKGSPKFPPFLMRMKWFRKLFFETNRDKTGFPRFISKTDETRIQNLPSIFADKETSYVVTEKIDGQSGTFFLEKKRSLFGKKSFDYGVCSRNLRLWKKDVTKPWWYVAEKHNLEYALRTIFEWVHAEHFVAIQGEVISQQAQGNKYNVNEPILYVFNLIVDGKILDHFDSINLIRDFGIKFVPVIATNYKLPETMDDLQKFVTGKTVVENGNGLREGFVFRNHEKGISFKCVSNEFLLFYENKE